MKWKVILWPAGALIPFLLIFEKPVIFEPNRYQIGRASSLEFRDAQVNLDRAQISLIIVRYQARITRLEIEQLIGNIEIQ